MTDDTTCKWCGTPDKAGHTTMDCITTLHLQVTLANNQAEGERIAATGNIRLLAQRIAAWQGLYMRAINEANGLLDMGEEGIALRGYARRIHAIEEQARKLRGEEGISKAPASLSQVTDINATIAAEALTHASDLEARRPALAHSPREQRVPERITRALRSLSKAWPVLAQHASHIDGEFDNALHEVKGYIEQLHESPAALTEAAASVLAERARQRTVEGWTEAHDDAHAFGELADAAAVYAMTNAVRALVMRSGASVREDVWPFSDDWFKPSPYRRRELVKAGALIIAEIERLDRTAARALVDSDAPGVADA